MKQATKTKKNDTPTESVDAKVEVFFDRKIHNETLNQIKKAKESIYIIRKEKEGKMQDMHNKYCVIDDKIVITGSFNWSFQAANYNFENIVVIESPEIAEKFKKQFFNIKKHAIPLQKGESIYEEYQKMIDGIMEKLLGEKEISDISEEMKEKASSITKKLFK